MDGSKLPTSIQTTSINPHAPPAEVKETEEVRHSSRLNRAVKSLKNVLKKLPGRSQRAPRNIPLQQRQVSTISQPRPGVMTSGATRPQAQADSIFRQVGDVFAKVKMGEGENPEVQRAFQQARNQYESAAIAVAKEVLSEARSQPDSGELILEMKDFIKQHESNIHQNYEPVTEDMVKDLRELPHRLLNELSLRNVDEQVAGEVFKAHLNDSRNAQTLLNHYQIPVSDAEVAVPGSTHDHKELFKLQKLQFGSARGVLKNEVQAALSEGRAEDAARLTKLDKQLLNLYGSYSPQLAAFLRH
ncbi:hypothetical protein [Endozoicomonas arenosclerae]|uniref:hypothetical protein n=1 Tax=Endozoicomonas arenosclerae TaxID=1633495 RepID=UPI0007863596|nr:hypothetical protein [Endozoicomonas arenosclerae]